MTLPQLDYAAWKFWISILQLIGIIGLGVYSWWTNREKVNNKRFRQLKVDIDKQVDKLQLEVDTKISREEADSIAAGHGNQCHLHRRKTDDLTRQANQIELTVRGLQTEVGHLPNQSDIGRVHSRMDDVAKEIDQAVGELRATRRQMDLVLEQLLKGGK